MRFLLLIFSIHFAIVLSFKPCPCRELDVEREDDDDDPIWNNVASCQCYVCLNKPGAKVEVFDDSDHNFLQKFYYAKNGKCPDIDDSIKNQYAPFNKDNPLGHWIKNQGKTVSSGFSAFSSAPKTVEWQCLVGDGHHWQPPLPMIGWEVDTGAEWEPHWQPPLPNPCATGKGPPHYAVCKYDLSISTPFLFEPNYL